MTFYEKLRAAQATSQSWLCVGLDPDPALMPDLPELKGPQGLAAFCGAIVAATRDLACAYKPNLAFFLAHGSAGLRALEQTLGEIPPHIPVVLDAKIGDIGSTQRMYGKAAFGALGADAVTVSPYVGEDAVLPLLEGHPGRGVFVLARTSNPDAPRFQDHPGSGTRLFELVVEAALGWAQAYPQSTVGLVVGSTHPGDLQAIRAVAPALPFLIPGIGAQGGALEAAVRFGAAADGTGPLINVSRAVIHASRGRDYADAAHQSALQFRQAINQLRARLSSG
jgi:orotidine-5'-phosphate decarboxylase